MKTSTSARIIDFARSVADRARAFPITTERHLEPTSAPWNNRNLKLFFLQLRAYPSMAVGVALPLP